MNSLEDSKSITMNPQLEIRGVIAQAIRDLVSLEQVGINALRGVEDQFQGADLGFALLLPQERPVPVWVTGEPQQVSQFLNSQGSLWEQVLFHMEGPEGIPGADHHFGRIEYDDHLIGLLVLGGGTAQMMERVDLLAAELTRAAKQLEKIAEVHRLSREMAILNSLAKSLTTSLELDGILVSAMQGVWELFHIEVANLFILDFESENTVVKIPLTGEPNQIFRYDVDLVKGVIGDCIRHQATALVGDVAQEPRFDPEVDGIEGYEIHSLLCVPLLAGDRSVGAISLINKVDATFTKHDLDLLATLAASLAAAIANARLFAELTEANTDLQESRREIERSRTTLMALFDNLDDELYIVDQDYTLIAVNRSRADRAGLDPRQLVGKLCYQVLEGRETPCEDCRAIETFEEGIKTHRTARTRGVDREIIEREIYTYPIVNAEGMVNQTILQIRDVTEQRRLEASLVQAEKLAALGQLAAGLAHELSNPVTAVIANTQLMQREIGPDASQRESLELIEKAGKRVQNAVRDLLDFARQERRDFKEVDINLTIKHAMALIRHQWQQYDLKPKPVLADPLPNVWGNADHLQSVWLNLLVNAHDALEGEPGEISVKSFLDEDRVTVQIRDTGVGIPEEHFPHLFEPFFTTKAPGKGTGLGLATAYRIVQQHKGEIHVESEVNEGTSITVSFPAIQSNSAESE